jgi:hypothetical protein
MNRIYAKTISSLEKVFPDTEPLHLEFHKSVLLKERLIAI